MKKSCLFAFLCYDIYDTVELISVKCSTGSEHLLSYFKYGSHWSSVSSALHAGYVSFVPIILAEQP
jgi:hypothetical protein